VSGTWGVTLQLELADAPVHCLKDSTVTSAQAGAPIPTAFSLIGTAGTYVLGSTFLDDEPRPEDWEQRLRARGARYVPGVEQARVIQRRACARPRSPDGRPLLGPVADGVWVATGHGGRGISTGAASGLLVARALLAGDAGLIPPALRAAR
jgi:glycine/D-amino acid oxidase-like deaminating enzyme